MVNDVIESKEYTISARFPNEPELTQDTDILNNVTFFEVTSDNSSVIVWSNGLHFLDENFNIKRSIKEPLPVAPSNIALSLDKKHIAISQGSDLVIFDLGLINDSGYIGHKITGYDYAHDITSMKFIDGNTLLVGSFMGALFIIDIVKQELTYKKEIGIGDINIIEYSIQSGLLALGTTYTAEIFSVKDNWKKVFTYKTFDPDRPDADYDIVNIKFNQSGKYLAIKSNTSGKIKIFDCQNEFKVLRIKDPSPQSMIRDFYQNEKLELKAFHNSLWHVTHLDFKNENTLLFSSPFKFEDHSNLHFGDPQKINTNFIFEVNIINNSSKILFSSSEYDFPSINTFKLFGSKSLILKCSKEIGSSDSEKKTFIFLVKIDNNITDYSHSFIEKENIPNKTIPNKTSIKNENEPVTNFINDFKTNKDVLDTIENTKTSIKKGTNKLFSILKIVFFSFITWLIIYLIFFAIISNTVPSEKKIKIIGTFGGISLLLLFIFIFYKIIKILRNKD